MRRITKGQLAAAQSELACIKQLAEETSSGRYVCYQFHAPAANRHISTLAAAKAEIPTWIISNWNYFKSIGWIPINLSKPEKVSA